MEENFDKARETYFQIREVAKTNEEILGFVLTGSRGKGFENQWSDYDFAIFVKEEALEKYQEIYNDTPYGAHLYIFSLSTFESYAAWGSDQAWDRYTWAHLQVDFDRTDGELQRILDEKGRVPSEHVEGYIDYSLRYFINQVYHSFKCLRINNYVGYRFEAAEGVKPYLQAIFCLYDRRVSPFYKYLEWELENFPLEKLSFSGKELLEILQSIQDTGNYQGQQILLREAARIFKPEGFINAFNAWSGSYQWLTEFTPNSNETILGGRNG
jgi:hypothetical protein